MCPLLFALVYFDDPIEKSATNFGDKYSITDNSLIPKRRVLEGKIKDKTLSLCTLFLQFYINNIQQILIINFISVLNIL